MKLLSYYIPVKRDGSDLLLSLSGQRRMMKSASGYQNKLQHILIGESMVLSDEAQKDLIIIKHNDGECVP